MPDKVHFVKGQTRKAGNVMVGDVLINTSTFMPAHCGIVTEAKAAVSGPVSSDERYIVTHATSKHGIKVEGFENWNSEAEMFRMKPELSKQEAEVVANITHEIALSASYGMGRAGFKSTFSSSTAGQGLLDRLEKYRTRFQDKNHQGFIKNVYCSELVITAYQLSCMINDFKGKVGDKDVSVKGFIDTDNRMFIKLDGKHCWPSTLRTYLKQSSSWEFLGLYKPK